MESAPGNQHLRASMELLIARRAALSRTATTLHTDVLAELTRSQETGTARGPSLTLHRDAQRHVAAFKAALEGPVAVLGADVAEVALANRAALGVNGLRTQGMIPLTRPLSYVVLETPLLVAERGSYSAAVVHADDTGRRARVLALPDNEVLPWDLGELLVGAARFSHESTGGAARMRASFEMMQALTVFSLLVRQSCISGRPERAGSVRFSRYFLAAGDEGRKPQM